MTWRALFFIVQLALLIAAALWVADHPGRVSVVWQEYVVETPLWVAALGVLVLMVAAALLYRLWRAVLRSPRRFGRWRRERRRARGYQALTRGLVAVAAGDASGAQKHARRAEVLLDEPPLTLLLNAQAAQLAGDDAAARRRFEEMLERPETAFLGTRGLLVQAMKRGDLAEAVELVRRAHRLRPDTPWVLSTRAELEARAGNWATAEVALADAARAGALPPGVDAKRRKAALLVAQSDLAASEGKADVAEAAAQRAHDAAPAFAPAAVRLAGMLRRSGRSRRAVKTLERAWKAGPHPDVARAYAAVGDGAPDALGRLKRMKRLLDLKPGHVESRVAVAEAALDARLWGEARKHLRWGIDEAKGEGPDRRLLLLMARLEQEENGDADAARSWAARAAEAPSEEAWTCSACGAPSEEWAPLCGGCGAFGTLGWRAPAGAVLLPASDGSRPILAEPPRAPLAPAG
jgi:HemY protein